MSTPRPAAAPRTLAQALRARSDASLAGLLVARPDLASPVPADLGQLAGRATSSASVARALNRLDAYAIELLEALVALPEPVDLPALATGMGDAAALVADRIGPLLDLALVWGDDTDLRAVRAVHELLGPTPAGLGPVTTRHFGDLDALIDAAGPEARSVLDELAWGPPTYTTDSADRQVTLRTARSPIEQLVARGLLVPRDGRTVALPRQIGLHLRGGRVHRETHPDPPPVVADGNDPGSAASRLAAHAAVGAALDLVVDTERVLDRLAATAPPVLRNGGLGVRDVRALGTAAALTEQRTAVILELAWTAGLVTELVFGSGEVFATTTRYAAWVRSPLDRRWAVLVRSWLTGIRAIGLVGGVDERGKNVNVFSRDLDRTLAPEIRALTLAALDSAGDRPADPGRVADRVTWHRPRRGGELRTAIVGWTLDEAATLGLTGSGVMSQAGRVAADLAAREPTDVDDPDAIEAVATDVERLAAAVADTMPSLTDEVLLQADLTATAPGPLDRATAEELRLMADPESHGVGAVYRFSPESVRRALDHGRRADGLLDWLTAHSRTEVPQPLAYLITDTARHHGVLRIGTAPCYLRCDDPAVLDALAGGAVPGLAFRRIADTVITTTAPAEQVAVRLADAGYTPVADDAGLVLATGRHRTEAEPPVRHAPATPRVDRRTATTAVERMRGADAAAAEAAGGSVEPDPATVFAGSAGRPAVETESILDLLAGVAEARGRARIGYTDTTGVRSDLEVTPLTVDAGVLTATVADGNDAPRRFAVHRIATARALEERQ